MLRRALISLALVSACATAPVPDRGAFITAAYESYPRNDFIVGYGFGPTPEEAERSARAEAAGQIKSEIVQNVRSFEGQTNAGGKETTEAKVTSETIEKIATDAGALIQADKVRTREARGGFEAIAYVSRDELDHNYEAAARSNFNKLLEAYTRALDAGTDVDTAGAAMCEVEGLEKQVEQKDRERRMVTKRTIWTDEARAKQKQIQVLQQKIKSSAELLILPASAKVSSEVSDQFVKSLVKYGFAARLVDANTPCSGKGMLLKLSVEPTCGKGPLAGVIFCKATYMSSATNCGTKSELFAFSSDQGIGTHQNEGLAEKQAMNKTDLPKFTRGVLDRLLQVLGTGEGCEK